MSTLLTAELAATCNALGSLDKTTGNYLLDDYTLDTIKDLIRYLRRDDEDHEIRRHLGQTKVLETDLVPILISHWEQIELFDVTLRLVVNLTNPPLLLYREEIPTEKGGRRCYLQITSHLQSYKANAFVVSDIWVVLGKRLTKILEMDQLERGEELGLIIERILILVRNVLHVPPDENEKNRPDNEASIHDQVLWALNQSGLLDIILYMSSESDKQYYMHIMEIISLALKEQNPSSLADASLHRSAEEKLRDEHELKIIRDNEVTKRKEKTKCYSANRHSRFGGTYVVQNMKSISDNDLICHKPLSSLTNLDFDINKTKVKKPKNKRVDDFSDGERRSAFAVRLFLKEFCIEFLNGSYNPIMHFVRDTLVRSKAQKNDESYYMWAMKFFMEFNRKHNFQVKFVSETMSVSTFHYVQQQMENFVDRIITEKKTAIVWIKRLHLSLKAYQELFHTLLAMDKSDEDNVKESSKVIKSNIFYVLEYREFILQLLLTFDETKMPKSYLKDLLETTYLFLKMLESFCKANSLVVQKKVKSKSKKSKKQASKPKKSGQVTVDKEEQWEEVAPQLSAVLQSDAEISTNILPFDATLEDGIDEQKADCMKKIQKLLLDLRYEDAIGLIRAAREVWPENDIFGAISMQPDEEFTVMRTIFMADIGAESLDLSERPEELPEVEEDEENDEEEEEDRGISHIAESDFSFVDFFNRFVNPKIIKACCLQMEQYERNSIYTNHCVLKIMHRIAWDCKYPSMFFQVSLFRAFQKLLTSKLDFHKELQKFALFIIRKFTEIAEKNPKVFMELLFWKTTTEAYQIENGYDEEGHKNTKGASWTDEQENELRVLYMENQTNPSTEKDVIDWIQEMLIDQTKTRRAIIKKLKELGLIFKAPTKKSTHQAAKAAKEKPPVEFTEEEDETLKKIWEEVSSSNDPMSMIIPRMPLKRPRHRIVDRLLALGLIKDKKECRKKRQKKGASGSHGNDSGESGSDDKSDSESDGDDSDTSVKAARNKKITKQSKKQLSKSKAKASQKPISNVDVIKSLMSAVDSGLSEALKWIVECMEEVALDQEAEGYTPDAVSVPIVPILDECIAAMENEAFLSTLRCIGIEPPVDEQESYWRIPGNIHFNSLHKRCETINKAIEKTLLIPEEQPVIESQTRKDDSSSEEELDDFFKRVNNIGITPQSNDSIDKFNKIRDLEANKNKKKRKNINSDSSDEDISIVRKKKKSKPEMDDENNKSSSDSEDESHNTTLKKKIFNAIQSDSSEDEIIEKCIGEVNTSRSKNKSNVIQSDSSENEDEPMETNENKNNSFDAVKSGSSDTTSKKTTSNVIQSDSSENESMQTNENGSIKTLDPSDKIENVSQNNKKKTLKKKSFNAIQSDSSEDESVITNENGSGETLNPFDSIQSASSDKIEVDVSQSRKSKSSEKKFFNVIQSDPSEDEADSEMKKVDQKEDRNSKSTEKNKSITQKKKLTIMSDSEDSDA